FTSRKSPGSCCNNAMIFSGGSETNRSASLAARESASSTARVRDGVSGELAYSRCCAAKGWTQEMNRKMSVLKGRSRVFMENLNNGVVLRSSVEARGDLHAPDVRGSKHKGGLLTTPFLRTPGPHPPGQSLRKSSA